MPTIDLKVQYFQDATPTGVPCREENFVRRQLVLPLPIEQTALVLVDLWNMHHIESWIERAEAMLDRAIIPLINRMRVAGLTIVQALCPLTLKDTAGVFIGSRMGRPEKAKMRKMTGSPHTLFPVGEEGGRLRSFQSADIDGADADLNNLARLVRRRLAVPAGRLHVNHQDHIQ